MPELRVTRIRTYPVKSLEGNDRDAATVHPWGLDGDRRWALIDQNGQKLTARKNQALLGLCAENSDGGGIRIHDRDGGSITVTPPDGPPAPVTGFRQLEHATPHHGDANDWISERIHQPARLIWQADPTECAIDPERGGQPGDTVSLADAAPLHLVTEASMRRLNELVAADAPLPDPAIDPTDISGTTTPTGPLDIVRFRPNVIIDGSEPFAEDNWGTFGIGGTRYRVTGLCGRCVMTTIDPVTLTGGKEPIRTLARHRRWDGLTWFGIRATPVGLTPDAPATIRVGDPVTVD